jgi:hypothetical protein
MRVAEIAGLLFRLIFAYESSARQTISVGQTGFRNWNCDPAGHSGQCAERWKKCGAVNSVENRSACARTVDTRWKSGEIAAGSSLLSRFALALHNDLDLRDDFAVQLHRSFIFAQNLDGLGELNPAPIHFVPLCSQGLG